MKNRQNFDTLPTREKMRPRKCRKMRPETVRKNR